MSTFNNILIPDITQSGLETQFGIKFDKNSQETETVKSVNITTCSCSKYNHVNNLENYNTTTEFADDELCKMCYNKMTEKCISCKNKTDDTKCIIVLSECKHKFHFCCVTRWLSTKNICPLCGKEWKFIKLPENKLALYYQDTVTEFDVNDNLMNNIAEKLSIDKAKFNISFNKKFVDKPKSGYYSLCSVDTHCDEETNLIKVNCQMNDIKKQLFIEYSANVNKLKTKISKLFMVPVNEIELMYNNVKLIDQPLTNLYNFDLITECNITIVEKEKNYEFKNYDGFIVVHQKNTKLTNVINGGSFWNPYPHIANVTIKNLTYLLSPLYVLFKKVNMNNEVIITTSDNFEKYLNLYDVNKKQVELAKQSLISFLKGTDFNNENRVILACSFYELITKIYAENSNDQLNDVFTYSNLVCDIIMSFDNPQKINWKFGLKNIRRNKTFNVYSPLILSNSVAPLLSIDENINNVVFTGKCKNVNKPVILYNPYIDVETDVNVAELGKKVENVADNHADDDRIYDEAVIVCFDTSNSMDNYSDFNEDIEIQKAEKKKAQDNYFEFVAESKVVTQIDDNDKRQLKNALIWFITHPNFMSILLAKYNIRDIRDILNAFILYEMNSVGNQTAVMMAKYKNMFVDLCCGKSITIDNIKYSFARSNVKKMDNKNLKFKTDVPNAYLCPISQEIMSNPVVAKDGFSYDETNILEWFKQKNTSPMTGNVISYDLINNYSLRSLIIDWISANKITDEQTNGTESKNISVTYMLNNVPELLIFPADDNMNVWDAKYIIYQNTGYNANEYLLTANKYKILCNTQSISQMGLEWTLELINKKISIHIGIHNTDDMFLKLYDVPAYYKKSNLLYIILSREGGLSEIFKYNLWYNMTKSGDGRMTGHITSHIETFESIVGDNNKKFYLFQKSNPYGIKTNCLTRLDICKKLFDSFVNRSIAYSFNTAIGLVSFSDVAKIECELTPYYESFRTNVDSLETNGGTALYDSLQVASEKLLVWKNVDKQKRQNAKLRIICLTDGHDTNSTNKYGVESFITKNGIVFDCIAIGSDFDTNLCKISKTTGGYIFNPLSIRSALDIMELETMISSVNRDPIPMSGYDYTMMIKNTTTPPMKKPLSLLKLKSMKLDQAVSKKFDDSKKNMINEIKHVFQNPHPDIDVYINDDIYFWKIIFNGPDGTPYKNGRWLAYIEFPKEYPYAPPHIRFVTPIKHCNINNYGRVCHSILDRNYTPNTKMSLILQCIYGLLLNPDVADPLDTNLALAYYEADGSYEAQIMQYVESYATKSRENWKIELTK